nr:contact-dependent growth inhibition system immunity protein [Paraburkholderia caballeronis]
MNEKIRDRFYKDFYFLGNSMLELDQSFIEKYYKNMLTETIHEIDQFKIMNPGDLDTVFERKFSKQCSPPLRGHTTASFLEELKRLLSE